VAHFRSSTLMFNRQQRQASTFTMNYDCFDLIPAEFQRATTAACEEDDNGLSELFALSEEDAGADHLGSSVDDHCLQSVSINAAQHTDHDDGSLPVSLTFHVRLPPDVATLFAHRVWSGSKVMADFLVVNRQYVEGKRTIELGAGTGIPSLVALACGSRCSILTDYPDDRLLRSIRETVGLNWEVCRRPLNRVAVIGHEWGSDVDDIYRSTANLLRLSLDESATCSFDSVFLSECLWMHRSHRDLAKSIHRLLEKERGTVVITYGHHVPGCESADDAFFDICANDYGLTTIHHETREADYMWNSSKSMQVHLRVLTREAGIDPL
jgi:predicted nicotinamide N-methyase